MSRFAALASLLMLAAPAAQARIHKPAALPHADKALERQIKEALAGFHGQYGIYALQLPTGREVAINANDTFPTASTIKVAIMATLFTRVEKGDLDYNGDLVYTSTRAYDDDDIVTNLKDGTKIRPAKLVWLMESMSDNTAARWCQDLAGGGTAINAWLASNGFATTRVNSRTPGREAGYAQWGWGQTTPREMARLLLLITTGKAVDAAASEEMLRTLSKSYWDGEALSQIPPTIHVASKQGAVDHSRSELLIVEAPAGRYVLAIYTKNQTDTRYMHDNEGYNLLRTVSGLVWRRWGGMPDWRPQKGLLRYYKAD